MIKDFVERWHEKKESVELLLRTNTSVLESIRSYKALVQLVLDQVLATEDETFDNLTVLDFGDYQGTQIFIFTQATYQPGMSETYYTNNSYGSCSGCDTMAGLMDDSREDRIKGFMSLMLHQVQRIKCMGERGEWF